MCQNNLENVNFPSCILLPWAPHNTWPEQRLSAKAFSHSKKLNRFKNFSSFHIRIQEKRHGNIHKLKTSQKLDQFFPNFILCFHFHHKWSCFCKWKENLKKKVKHKTFPECKKIFGCLACQNQALDDFNISLLKELAHEIKGKVPQEWL